MTRNPRTSRKPRKYYTKNSIAAQKRKNKAKGDMWLATVKRALRLNPNDIYIQVVRQENTFTSPQAVNTSNAGSYVLQSLGSLSFDLTQTREYTEFTNLYDYYRIKAVEVTIMPYGNAMVQNPDASTYGGILKLMSFVDNDDTSTPSFTDFQERGCAIRELDRPIRLLLKPKPLNAIYGGAITTGYSVSKENQWIDTNDATIPHYGLKYCVFQQHLNPASASEFSYYSMMVRYVLEFKGMQ